MSIVKYAIHIFSTIIILVSYCTEARAISDAEASRETEIPNLHVINSATDIVIGYVDHDTPLGKYSCGGMTLSAVQESAKIVKAALSILPPPTLVKAKPKYIILCSKATAGGQKIGGIPVPPLNLLMLSVGGISADDVAYGKHIVLHELYHLVEYRFGTFNDADWNSRFGSGYANSYAGRIKESVLGDGKSEFINSYSESFPHEERAELFSFLLTEPNAVERLIAKNRNPTLRSKIMFFANKCNALLGTHISLAGM